jgi:hypothetical protein
MVHCGGETREGDIAYPSLTGRRKNQQANNRIFVNNINRRPVDGT